MEDFSLRFTAKSARKWSPYRVGNTALGAISFLALEVIGATITYNYGFTNVTAAIIAVGILIFLTGLPISYYAAKYGVDIDLLSRGAGFGYIGSTITSLIYASFTFIFFALEAAIMAKALEIFFSIPLFFGYLISSLIIIPMVINGFTFISRLQVWTQPLWLLLHSLPFIFIAANHSYLFEEWTHYTGILGNTEGNFDLLLFGAASAVLFSLSAQIGEQVDFLRFLPPKTKDNAKAWWISLLSAGPGWIVVGGLKIFVGSFLLFVCLKFLMPVEMATEPSYMYHTAFNFVFASSWIAALVAATFVIISQIKINVTNAYAGSIAWSNFFSRLTHSHPGRVVWLIFNVGIAFLLITLGAYHALENILALYSIVAVAWVGALASDLVINKPLRLSPKYIEFRRAYLYDINPVGVGSVALAVVVAAISYVGLLGETMAALFSFVALGVSFFCAPIIAYLTNGKYYIARKPSIEISKLKELKCCICENVYEAEDMASCPIYDAPICSLCCSLDARCHDSCKEKARYVDQISGFLLALLPKKLTLYLNPIIASYIGIQVFASAIIASVLGLVYLESSLDPNTPKTYLSNMLWDTFFIMLIISAVASWLFVLARESTKVAQEESSRQTFRLYEEIAAHTETDKKLQLAKEIAESASQEKSKFIVGLSHEFRTPLNTILGYSQILDRDENIPQNRSEAVQVIRKGSEHLADLIKDLLDISQIETGKLVLEKNTINIRDFLDDIAQMFKLDVVSNKLNFVFLTKDPLPELILGDQKRLRQVYLNILSNAFKYTPSGSIKVTVSFKQNHLKFCVEDTGIGISAQDIKRLFIPFNRIKTDTFRDDIVGTGLGLSISKLLVERMNGQLLVESEVGIGTTFIVDIPVSNTFTNVITNIESPQTKIIGYSGKKLNIVVTDDDDDHCNLLMDILKPLDFEVKIAKSARECLDVIKKYRANLFLLDISMPEMDGIELATILREKYGKQVKIIMLSANSEDDIDLSIKNKPFDFYLMKPFLHSELISIMQKLLNLSWRYQELENTNEQKNDITNDEIQPIILRKNYHESLMKLARAGDIRALQSKLKQIANEDPSSHSSVTRLQKELNNFNLESFKTILSEKGEHHDAQ
jgi:signal transduction histidine kinase/FixJ family two-component response regulator